MRQWCLGGIWILVNKRTCHLIHFRSVLGEKGSKFNSGVIGGQRPLQRPLNSGDSLLKAPQGWRLTAIHFTPSSLPALKSTSLLERERERVRYCSHVFVGSVETQYLTWTQVTTNGPSSDTTCHSNLSRQIHQMSNLFAELSLFTKTLQKSNPLL